MSERRVTEPDRADADTLEVADAQPEQFTHHRICRLRPLWRTKRSWSSLSHSTLLVSVAAHRGEAVVQESEAPGVDEDPAARDVGVRVTTRTEAMSAISLEIHAPLGATITVQVAGR